MDLRLLVTGGYFDETGECVILEVDLGEGRVRDWGRWTPPDRLRVPTKGFTGARIHGDSLFVCGHACLTRWSLETGQLDGVLHQPDFNDLHDVAIMDGVLHLAVTGSDAIDRFDLSGRFLGRSSALPGWVLAAQLDGRDLDDLNALAAVGWAGEAPRPQTLNLQDAYYSTRAGEGARPFWQQKVPDHLHFNHVTDTVRGPVVTCLRDGTLRSAHTFEVLARVPGHPHDGLPQGETLWCTTVDGGVWRVPLSDGEPERCYEAFVGGRQGWCRGLLLTNELVVVGLTALRDGKAPPGMWKGPAPEDSQTGLAVLDRRTGEFVQWIGLEPHRPFKIFSIELLT